MGPNGSGKTTLLKILATEISSRNAVRVLGHDKNTDLQRVRKQMAFAGDSPVHLEGLTGVENAELFLDLYGLSRQDAESTLESLFRSFGLSEVRDVPVSAYSHGMKKKLQLLESFVHHPELMILDEPTLGLDPPGVEAFIDCLTKGNNKPACVVLATNDPLVAARVATSVVFLVDGSVIARGEPEVLLDQLDRKVKVDIWVTGDTSGTISLEANGIVSMVHPGKITASMPSHAEPLPGLMESILNVGLEISRVEITKPTLSDVFLLLTGRSLTESPRVGRSSPT